MAEIEIKGSVPNIPFRAYALITNPFIIYNETQ